jgi:hypothetical protein
MMFPMPAPPNSVPAAIDDALRAGDAVRLTVAVERDAARLREAGGRRSRRTAAADQRATNADRSPPPRDSSPKTSR